MRLYEVKRIHPKCIPNNFISFYWLRNSDRVIPHGFTRTQQPECKEKDLSRSTWNLFKQHCMLEQTQIWACAKQICMWAGSTGALHPCLHAKWKSFLKNQLFHPFASEILDRCRLFVNFKPWQAAFLLLGCISSLFLQGFAVFTSPLHVCYAPWDS